MNQDSGWVLSGRILFTADQGGHWKDITPAAKKDSDIVRSVHFHTERHASALVSHWDRVSRTQNLDVYSTSDGGATWTQTALDASPSSAGKKSFSGTGDLFFLDDLHGWVNLGIISSANFNLGTLLETSDGGKTWVRSQSNPGIAGTVKFTSLRDGWVAGGPGHQRLLVTHDGARSWQRINVEPPPGLQLTNAMTYALPEFDSKMHGYLPVTILRQSGLGAVVVLYESKDGGQTWIRNRVHAVATKSTTVPISVVHSQLLTAKLSGGSGVDVSSVSDGGNLRTIHGAVSSRNAKVAGESLGEPSFTDEKNGWVRVGDQILATSDGGNSWTDITPPSRSTDPNAGKSSAPGSPSYGFQPHPPATIVPKASPIQAPAKLVPSRLAVAEDAPADPIDTGLPASGRLGFDVCSAPGVDVMQSWWNLSPYYVAGIYIGGNNQACTQTVLDSSWTSQVSSQGWSLMPLWAGSQPSCSCQVGSTDCVPADHLINTNLDAAAAQGASEANDAITSASSLGLSGIIYLDMSAYDIATCGASVSQYIGNWVSTVHANGFLAGLHAPGEIVASISSLDGVWIEQPNGQASILDLSPLDDTVYPVGQRAHQYVQNATVDWGDISIDAVNTSLVAAPLFPGDTSQQKSYDFTYVTVDYPGASGTVVTGINNVHNGSSLSQSQIGTVVGYYTDGTTGVEGSFMYDGTTFTPIYVPGSLSTIAYAINDQNMVVGNYLAPLPGGGSTYTGFSYSNGTYTTITPPDTPVGPNLFYMQLTGINDNGVAVGEYGDAASNGFEVGFTYDTSTETFSDVSVPGSLQNIAFGINGFNQVEGMSFGTNFGLSEFLLDAGNYTPLPSPPFFPTNYALNNNGQAGGAGQFIGSNFSLDVGYPGFVSGVGGLNDSAQIVGFYTDSTETLTTTHGLVAIPNGVGTGRVIPSFPPKLLEVDFTNSLKIWEDGNSSALPLNQMPLDPTAVWYVPSGSSTPLRHASGFISGSKIQARLNLKMLPVFHPALPGVRFEGKITGTGLTGCVTNELGRFIATTDIAENEPGVSVGFESSGTFSPNTVNQTEDCNSLEVEWFYSPTGLPCSAVPNPCISLGITDSEVYVTLTQPSPLSTDGQLPAGTIPRTVMMLAIGAGGARDAGQSVVNTWNMFSGPANITGWDHRNFCYYPSTTCRPDPSSTAPSTATGFGLCAFDSYGLLTSTTGAGQCGSFARLLMDALATNGNRAAFIPIQAHAAGNDLFMLVKNWTFQSGTFFQPPTFGGYTFSYQLFLALENTGVTGMVPLSAVSGDLVSGSGEAGQNSPTPSEKVFFRHFIVKSGPYQGNAALYFDPSYGKTYMNSCDFESQAVAGYAFEIGQATATTVKFAATRGAGCDIHTKITSNTVQFPDEVALAITTVTLPNGQVGAPYSASIDATGGLFPYLCQITSGTLPVGLTLAGCTITGTPTTAGTSNFTVNVSDSDFTTQSTNQPVVITILP